MTNPAVEQREKQIKEMAEIIEKACSRTNCTNYECYECYAQALWDKGYRLVPELPSVISTAQAVKEVTNAKKEERERIRQEFNKRNAPDAKDWQTGTGGKLYKVLLFTKKEWCDFWQALKSEEG